MSTPSGTARIRRSFSPVAVPRQDIDVFFYGHGREYRSGWIDSMIRLPSQRLPEARFAVRGNDLGDIGSCETLPYLSFSKLRAYVCRSKNQPLHHARRPCQRLRLVIVAPLRAGCVRRLHRRQSLRRAGGMVRAGQRNQSSSRTATKPWSAIAICCATNPSAGPSAWQPDNEPCANTHFVTAPFNCAISFADISNRDWT